MDFEIQRNLFEYLKQRRESPASVMLWIDALCIYQSSDKESLAERSAQVPRMTSIYMNADAIEIWLGPEKDGSSLAMDELNHLATTVIEKIAKPRAFRSYLSSNLGVDEGTYELHEIMVGWTK